VGVDKDYLSRQITAADPADHKSSTRFATDVPLPAYARVGNVITASANGALPANGGVTPALNDSLFLTSDGSASDVDNGIYVVTQLGSAGTPFILTRRGDCNANDLVTAGMCSRVEEGTFAGQEFVLITPNPIVVNTTPLVFELAEGGVGGFTNIPLGQVKSIAADEQVIFYGPMTISGTLRLSGSLVAMPVPAEIEVVAEVTSGPTAVPNNSQVPVDPSAGALTIELPNTGTPGQVVTIKNVTSSLNVITVDGMGRKMDGANIRTLTTAYENLQVRRKRNQNWDVL